MVGSTGLLLFVIMMFFVATFAIYLSNILALRKTTQSGLTLQTLCGSSIIEQETARFRLYEFIVSQGRYNNTVVGTLAIICALMFLGCLIIMYLWFKQKYILKDAPIHYVVILVLYILAVGFMYAYKLTIEYVKTSMKTYMHHIENLRGRLYSALSSYEVTRGGSPSKKPGDFTTDGKAKFRELMTKRILSIEELPSIIDAEARYSELLASEAGQRRLIGYTKFDQDTEDYTALSLMLCKNYDITLKFVTKLRALRDMTKLQEFYDLFIRKPSSPENDAAFLLVLSVLLLINSLPTTWVTLRDSDRDGLYTLTTTYINKSNPTSKDTEDYTEAVIRLLVNVKNAGRSRSADAIETDKTYLEGELSKHKTELEGIVGREIRMYLRSLHEAKWIINDVKPCVLGATGISVTSSEKSFADSLIWMSANTNRKFPKRILTNSYISFIIASFLFMCTAIYPVFHYMYRELAPSKAILTFVSIILLIVIAMFIDGVVTRAAG
jgi:hypothetical protein